jgi:hypothetical protein
MNDRLAEKRDDELLYQRKRLFVSDMIKRMPVFILTSAA